MITFFLAASFLVSSSYLEINEPLKAQLIFEKEASVNLDVLRGNLLSRGHFMLLDETVIQNGKTTITWLLEPLQTGTFPLSLYHVEAGDQSFYAPIYQINVKPFVKPDQVPFPSLLPLTPQVPPTLTSINLDLMNSLQNQQPEYNRSHFLKRRVPGYTLLALFILGLLTPLIYLFLTRNKEPVIALSPEETALKSLILLEHNINDKKVYPSHQAFITDLSEVLREFIFEKYGLKAPFQTTEELIEALNTHPVLSGTASERLVLFLKASDFVKFSGRNPTSAEMSKALHFAKGFVNAS